MNKQVSYQVLILMQWIVGNLASDLSTYNSCCQTCHGSQELWMSTHPDRTWKLEVEGEYVHNFLSPVAGFIGEVQEVKTELFGRTYTLRYSGMPVQIVDTNISDSVLEHQYVQVDLTLESKVAGISVQEGKYEDLDNDLFYHRHTWLTSYALSHSTDGIDFVWVQDAQGQPRIFEGVSESSPYRMQDLGLVLSARYVRLHPLFAMEHGGETTNLLVRVGVVTCSQAPHCVQPKYHCVLMTWGTWSSCNCDWAGCTQTRTRDIAFKPACGGDYCEDTTEAMPCVPSKVFWQLALIIVGVLLVLALLALCLYKKFKKEPEFVIKNKEKWQHVKKEKKQRELRSDLAGNRNIEVEEMNEDANDFIEKDIMPKKKPLFQSKTETKGPNDSDIVDDIEESPAEPQTHHMEDDTTANNGPAEMDATANHSNEARTVVCETMKESVLEAAVVEVRQETHTLEGGGVTVVGIDGKPQNKRKHRKKKIPTLAAADLTDHAKSGNALPTSAPSQPSTILPSLSKPAQGQLTCTENSRYRNITELDVGEDVELRSNHDPEVRGTIHVRGIGQGQNSTAEESDCPPPYNDLYI